MGDFHYIKQYNKKYTKELNDSLKIIMPTLIEAFVNVYGNRFREYITYTLNHLNFIFFIPERLFQVVLTYSKDIRKHDRYVMEYYLKYLEKLYFINRSISEEKHIQFLLSKFLLKSPFKAENFDYTLMDALESDCPCFTFGLINENVSKFVLLPIFAIDLNTIIHEFNHALSIDALAIKDDTIITNSLFADTLTEELVNDYIAQIVYKEYKRIGGVIPYSLRRFSIINSYQIDDYIIKYFYDTFKDVILYSLITKNDRLFYEVVNKEDIEKIYPYIHKLFCEGEDILVYKKLIELINNILGNIDLEQAKRLVRVKNYD